MLAYYFPRGIKHFRMCCDCKIINFGVRNVTWLCARSDHITILLINFLRRPLNVLFIVHLGHFVLYLFIFMIAAYNSTKKTCIETVAD